MRRMREGGASLRRIANDFECSASTVLRAATEGGGDAMTEDEQVLLIAYLVDAGEIDPDAGDVES